ncbi:MAG: aminoglycoside phosphotransferase family protein, partial [Caldilinea sp.]
VVMSALPGRPLYALLDEPILPELLVASGRALRILHDSALPASVAVHDARSEQSVIHRWLARVSEFAPHLAPILTQRAKSVLATLDAPEGGTVLLHRDFYDKQIVVDEDGSIGVLDFDTMAAGEAALDVANALVHLHLRAVQRDWSTEHLFRACQSFLDGYAADDAILRRLPTYADATRLRLACVYAMRPSKADVVLALVQSIEKPVAGL